MMMMMMNEQVDDGTGTADADVDDAAPRSSTPAAGDDAGAALGAPGSPNSRMSDDISSIGSDDDRKTTTKDAVEDRNAAAAQFDREDGINDSGVVVDGVEASSGRAENGSVAAATCTDPTGKGLVQPGATAGFVCLVEGCNANFPSKRSRDRHRCLALFVCSVQTA